jgi:hypothetical protein
MPPAYPLALIAFDTFNDPGTPGPSHATAQDHDHLPPRPLRETLITARIMRRAARNPVPASQASKANVRLLIQNRVQYKARAISMASFH